MPRAWTFSLAGEMQRWNWASTPPVSASAEQRAEHFVGRGPRIELPGEHGIGQLGPALFPTQLPRLLTQPPRHDLGELVA